MVKARHSPCVLALGGLDPGGGAGLFADGRAIVAAGAFPCGVATLLTIQSTSGLKRVIPVPPREVQAQAREVLAHQDVRAFKVGALGEADVVRAVARLLSEFRQVPAIIDTPMLPSRGGAALLRAKAIDALRAKLVPCATLLTVNAPEAAVLAGMRVSNLDQAESAAKALVQRGARAVLVKGGHLEGANATDLLVVGGKTIRLVRRRLDVGRVHGTGCALASLIAGRLAVSAAARDDDIVASTRWAKARLHRALAASRDVGGAQRVIVY